MTKRETLTESMRRLSNIVNEAELVNEIDIRDILTNPRKAAKNAASDVGSSVGKALRDKQLSKRDKQVSNSSLRQHENLQDLVNSFTRELGDDPNQWAGKLDAYFEDLREPTAEKIRKLELKYNSIYSFPSREAAARNYTTAVMGKFDKELGQLVEACREYARDPYSVEPQKHLSKTARNVLEKIKRERPAAPTLPANHLNAVYKELAKAKDANFVPTEALKVLGWLMLVFFSMVMLGINDDMRRERDRKARQQG